MPTTEELRQRLQKSVIATKQLREKVQQTSREIRGEAEPEPEPLPVPDLEPIE